MFFDFLCKYSKNFWNMQAFHPRFCKKTPSKKVEGTPVADVPPPLRVIDQVSTALADDDLLTVVDVDASGQIVAVELLAHEVVVNVVLGLGSLNLLNTGALLK